MVDVTIKPTEQLSGEISAPPSKSYTHRVLIAALLSNGKSRIENYLICDDTIATLNAIRAFGAEVRVEGNYLEITGIDNLKNPKEPIDCRESGATLRFIIPIAALAPGKTIIKMAQSLSRRPIKPLLESLRDLGVESRYFEGDSIIRIYGGRIRGGETRIRGDISSQFISGLIFACPKAETSVEINIITPLESKNYVLMTEEVVRKHGIRVFISENFEKINLPAPQRYSPYDHKVQGDFSSAAYVLTAAAITSSEIRLTGLCFDTNQGDKEIVNILKQAGLKVEITREYVTISGQIERPIEVDAKDIPDLVPACAALACYANGISKIYNVKRLRYKESDRVISISTELRKMGAKIFVDENCLIVRGPCEMHGAVIDPHNDHRIAMACSAAALRAKGETRIINAECVRKSYPSFFKDLRLLGANIIGGEFNW
ncbi:MAG: 3-phosphoshikimate 1-carboxyvinyltransferase [Candidatus Bathyarchaeia archaeon]